MNEKLLPGFLFVRRKRAVCISPHLQFHICNWQLTLKKGIFAYHRFEDQVRLCPSKPFYVIMMVPPLSSQG